ncbi:MAG: glycosyl hydrolase 115 family protein [Prolixibacteraceae bacterium]
MKTILIIIISLICINIYGQKLNSFILVNDNSQSVIKLSNEEPKCVQLAVQDLISDVKKITGKTLIVNPKRNRQANVVYIETKPNPSKWESYSVISQNGNLYITGSDERGTMFGIFHFIEKYLDVDPLYFWSGREPQKRSTLSWDLVSITTDGPSVKFRGWFINDEDLLTFWKEGGGTRNLDYKFYFNIIHKDAISAAVEALVRSRYNLFIPASFIDILNPKEEELIKECARRGIFISQHHQEPMGVSPFAFFNYWKGKGKDAEYSYITNKEGIQEVWREATKKWSSYPNVIWQLGLRGIGDKAAWLSDKNFPVSNEERGALISSALADQKKILEEICPKNYRIYTSMTLWLEGSVLNQKGFLKIPAGTILVFSDNCPGWKWPADFYNTPRDPKNLYGVYYHHALIGSGPHLAQVVSPQQTFGLLKIADEFKSSDYAVFNVSNIREFVLGIAATEAMTWNIRSYNPDTWFDEWIAERFSNKKAEITNAYKIYFDAYQIHDKQHVPFLMDGQMFGLGKNCLTEMEQKLKEQKIGIGTDSELIYFKSSDRSSDIKSANKEEDAYKLSLIDAIPEKIGRRETIKRISMQKAGFNLASLHLSGLLKNLPKEQEQFLFDNLIYPNDLMLNTCSWLENLYLADEALDLGNIEECVKYLDMAEKAISKISKLSENYCYGKWTQWYRGERILNISISLAKTHEVVALLQNQKKQ